MTDYSFRIRFIRSPTDTVNIESASWEIIDPNRSSALTLLSRDQNKTIRTADELVLKGSGLESEEDAALAGQYYLDVLMVSLARLRVGADFGHRAARGVMMPAGLAMFERQTGSRCLNDEHGLMIYKTEPTPRFVRVRAWTVLRGAPADRFERVFRHALENPPTLNERDRLSLDLFNASFFQQTVDTKFLLLMMAVEALLEPPPRSEEAVKHVKALIQATSDAQALTESERDSILGSLRWLLNESISRTGRELASRRLSERRYLDNTLSAPAFFSRCYGVRSRLVHGDDPFPSRDEVSRLAASLEQFVSDLLSGPLIKLPL